MSESSPEQSPPAAEEGVSPWYQDGLCFECTGCGNCCTGLPGFVWVEEEDLVRIAEYLDKPIGEIRLLRTRPAKGRVSLTEYANGDCTFFDPQHRSCTIYPVRPAQCRSWPFWQSNLANQTAWERVSRDCPGIGTGPLVPLKEIEDLTSDDRL